MQAVLCHDLTCIYVLIVAPTTVTTGGITKTEVGGVRSTEATPTDLSALDELQFDPEVDALLDSLLKEISH